MERNIGEQLNKAFEAYRQASIEKDNAKKELQQMTEHYERQTQMFQKQIEDQQQLISKLEAQLLSTARQASGETICEHAPRKQEEELLLPCNHPSDGPAPFLKESVDSTLAAAHTLPVSSSVDNKVMMEAFEAIQGQFQQIQSLTRTQKHHLKRFHRGKDTRNVDQRFSMPIQCTDGTAEQADRPFPSALRSPLDIPPPPASLASRGASPEDGDLDSLAKLSLRFPPPADSEYDFLNSAPERHLGLVLPGRPAPRPAPANPAEEEAGPARLAEAFAYPSPPSPALSSVSLSQEAVRGPQQALWSPALCHASPPPPAERGPEPEPEPCGGPEKCEFCHAVVPHGHMNSHLYSHFSHNGEASD